MITILGSMVNTIREGGGLYDHLMNTRIKFTLTMIKIFIQAQNIMTKMAMASICIR